MSNGNIWPSATGGGLERGANNFLKGLIAKRELAQRDRQLGQADRQLGQADRQLDQLESWQAFQELMTIAPFLPKGMPIGEMSGLHDMMSKALPEIDPADPTFKNFVLSPETFETTLNELSNQRFKEMAETPEGQKMLDFYTNMRLTGTAGSTKGIELADAQKITGAEIYMNSWEYIKSNPELFEQLARVNMNLQQPVSFTDPRTGESFTYDTAQGAGLTVELMKHWSMMGFEWEKLNSTTQNDIVKEFMDQAKTADVVLGRAPATQMVMAWNNQVQAQQRGDIEAGTSTGPWFDLEAAFTEKSGRGGNVARDADSSLKAMRLLSGAISVAEMTFEEMVAGGGMSDQLNSFLGYSGMIEERFGTSNPKANLGLVRDILDKDPSSGVRITGGRFSPYKLQFVPTPDQMIQSGGDQTQADASAIRGVPLTEEQQVENSQIQFRQDVMGYLSGALSVTDIEKMYADRIPLKNYILSLKRD